MPGPDTHPPNWPTRVPAAAQARAMLRGEASPGTLHRQHEEFLASLVGLERAALSSGRPAALESALVARFRASVAVSTMPSRAEEVDQTALAALVLELRDEVLGAMTAEQAETGPLKVVLRQGREQLDRSTTALKSFAPDALPAAVPPQVPDQLPASLRSSARAAADPGPGEPRDLERAAKVVRLLLVLGALGLGAGLFHGIRHFSEQSELEAQRAAQARVPEEVSSGNVTAIFLRDPTPEKVAELEARAQREGKRLLKLSASEFQLVPARPGAPAPEPAPPVVPDAPAPEAEPAADAGAEEVQP